MLLVLGLLACASTGPRAALGWSLGGEAHVFVTGDRFARELYRELTGTDRLADTLARSPLVAVADRRGRVATVLSASGAAPARLTLARFHARAACGPGDVVTEMVLAFPPGGGGHSTPPSHVTVVAMIGSAPFAGGAGTLAPAMSGQTAVDLVRRVANRAEGGHAALLGSLALDPDRAADAGEVVSLARVPSGLLRYAVGFRVRYLTGEDTMLVTGVGLTDPELVQLRWVVRPSRARLRGGTIAGTGRAVRYSLRGTVAAPGGGSLLLLDEIADVALRDSRAIALDPVTRRILATQPLALRCP